MYLFLGLAFGTFVGVLVTLDRQSKGIQVMACAALLAILALFTFYVVNPSAVMSGIHSVTGL